MSQYEPKNKRFINSARMRSKRENCTALKEQVKLKELAEEATVSGRKGDVAGNFSVWP